MVDKEQCRHSPSVAAYRAGGHNKATPKVSNVPIRVSCHRAAPIDGVVAGAGATMSEGERAMMKTRVPVPLALLIWVVVGIILASSKNYGEIHDGSQLATFILAIVLWPILAFDGSVAIHF